jgi:hypothetical protein
MIFNFVSVWNFKSEQKSKTVGAHLSAALSEQQHRTCQPRSDHDRHCSASRSFTTDTAPAVAHAAFANRLHLL